MAVMTGFQVTLREKILGADAHIAVGSFSGKINEWQDVSKKIKAVPGVASVSAYTQNQVFLQAQNGSSGVVIRGVEKGSSAASQLSGWLVNKGDITLLFDPPPMTVVAGQDPVVLPGVIVGKELARSLALRPGTPVSLLASETTSTPFGLVPKSRRMLVVASYQSGLLDYEASIAYVSLEEAQRFFRMGDSVTGFEVRVDAIDDAPRVSREVLQALGGVGSGFYSRDWTERNKAFFEAMALEKKVYFIVLLLIIVMASFSIISSLIMVVIEKRKDIAIMRTLGATTSSVANIFRFQGAVIGGIGVSVGLAGGFIGCILLQKYGFPIDERIFQMSTLPVHIDPMNFIVVGISAFAICCLATLYPARRASRTEPVEALRFE